MRKIIILIFLISTFKNIAQNNFQYKVKYDWKASSEEFRNQVLSDPKMDARMRLFIEERMKKMFNKTFILQINNNLSLYDEDALVSINDVSPDLSGIYSNIAYFKDLKEKEIIIQKEFNGKNFFVKDSLIAFKWKLINEKRKIGEYICYKATTIINENKVAVSNTKSTNFLDNLEDKKEVEITAWYAPDIPINQGPENFWGLPGLILEIYENNSSIVCSEIIINPKKKIKIKLPEKSKIISQSSYNAMVKKKNDEMEHD